MAGDDKDRFRGAAEGVPKRYAPQSRFPLPGILDHCHARRWLQIAGSGALLEKQGRATITECDVAFAVPSAHGNGALMWRNSQAVSLSSALTREALSASTLGRERPVDDCDDLRSYSSEEIKIGEGQFVEGKICGTAPLFIDGRVEGDIDIPNERVTIGEHGVFVAHIRKDGQFGIIAREVIIMGQVIGSVSASHRVEIFQSGSITGDLQTPRLSIADGGFLKGGVNLREDKRELREGAA